MAGSKGNVERDEPGMNIEKDLDALFSLPLAEFTAARNALATRLKKAGSVDGAEHVKALVKPPLSAWAVNQLYWRHADAFKELIAAGKRLGSAQASQLAGRTADLRGLLAERREMLSNLVRLAETILRDSVHNPTPDIVRRITATLEALSTTSSLENAPRPGRLTADVDPPGFESLAALVPAPSESRVAPRQKTEHQDAVALHAAEQALREMQTRAQDATAALQKATAHASQTESERRDAEERLAKARVAAEEARLRLRDAESDAKKASKAVEEAERAVERARG
jgi:hypothetical protein